MTTQFEANEDAAARHAADLIKAGSATELGSTLAEDFFALGKDGTKFADFLKRVSADNAEDRKANDYLPGLDYSISFWGNTRVNLTTPGEIFGNLWRNKEEVFADLKSGKIIGGGPAASGNETAIAEGSSWVVALGNSHVITQFGADVDAYGNAQVTCKVGTRVTAFRHSQVTAAAGCGVNANEDAQVTAEAGSGVRADDRARVIAESGSHVSAYENSQVTAQLGSEVDVHDQATVISGH
jgi:hypothetical protein